MQLHTNVLIEGNGRNSSIGACIVGHGSWRDLGYIDYAWNPRLPYNVWQQNINLKFLNKRRFTSRWLFKICWKCARWIYVFRLSHRVTKTILPSKRQICGWEKFLNYSFLEVSQKTKMEKTIVFNSNLCKLNVHICGQGREGVNNHRRS